jgi:hypothetical protein
MTQEAIGTGDAPTPLRQPSSALRVPNQTVVSHAPHAMQPRALGEWCVAAPGALPLTERNQMLCAGVHSPGRLASAPPAPDCSISVRFLVTGPSADLHRGGHCAKLICEVINRLGAERDSHQIPRRSVSRPSTGKTTFRHWIRGTSRAERARPGPATGDPASVGFARLWPHAGMPVISVRPQKMQ